MYTLGINAAFHDPSACIIRDGLLLAAAEEERFTHIKHGKRPIPFSAYELPFHAIDYCLRVAGIHLRDVDLIASSYNPCKLLEEGTKEGQIYSKWDPIFLSFIVNAPGQLEDGYPHHLQARFAGAGAHPEKWHFVGHHIAHAASAFLPSPFDSAAVMTIDGRGEQATTSYYLGKGNKLDLIAEVNMPHSLGLLYEAVTGYLGFLPSSDEYKVMALASYGHPVHLDKFRSLIHVGSDGKYTIDELDLVNLFGPARVKDGPLTQDHFDIAHSLQKVLEETVLKLVNWLHLATGEKNLALAGGVALNCVLNAYIRDNGPFSNIWVQPAAGDAGTALGAALWVDVLQRKDEKRLFRMDHAYWGPAFEDEEIEKFLKWTKVPYTKLDDVAGKTAAILAQDKVIGWDQGRMEFCPLALGSPSILSSPISPFMQSRLNEIKDREDFRPVAPVVLEEEAGDWFEDADQSPFMLFVHKVKEEKSEKIPALRPVLVQTRFKTVKPHQHS